MPKRVQLRPQDWDELIDLLRNGAAKNYICQRFGITRGELKKILTQLGMRRST